MIFVKCDKIGCRKDVEHGKHHRHIFMLSDGVSPVLWEGHLCNGCENEVLVLLRGTELPPTPPQGKGGIG